MKATSRAAHIGVMIYIMRRHILDRLGPTPFRRLARALRRDAGSKVLCPASGWTHDSILDAVAILADRAAFEFHDQGWRVDPAAKFGMAACHLFDVTGGGALADRIIAIAYNEVMTGQRTEQYNMRLGSTDVAISVFEWLPMGEVTELSRAK